MNRERELKYAAQSSEPPPLPHGWSLGPERSVAEIVDTYLDHAATLITRGWALRRRETLRDAEFKKDAEAQRAAGGSVSSAR